MSLSIEETLLNTVKKLLANRVNEFLGELEYPIPPIEFSPLVGGEATAPVIRLSTCERTEKERIINIDAYTLTIIFTIPENPEGERNCYAYAGTVVTALEENPSLGGTVDRAVLTGKKYAPPKHPGTGEDWELTLTLRVTVEGIGL
jgi:hypothetical protein